MFLNIVRFNQTLWESFQHCLYPSSTFFNIVLDSGQLKFPKKFVFFFRKMWPSSSRWTQSLCPIVKIVARGHRPWCQLASKSPHIRIRFITSCFFIKKGNSSEVLQPNRVNQGNSRCYKLNSQIFQSIRNSFQIFRSPRLANNRNRWLFFNFPSLPYLASNKPPWDL